MGKLELIIETDCVSMYSPKWDGETYTEFEKFLIANKSHTHPQLKKSFDAIISVIKVIGEKGAMERYFRLEGGRVKAIPLFIELPRIDRSIGKMRLYCLRFSDNMLVIGNGAVTKSQKYQEDPNLTAIINSLRNIERKISQEVKSAGIDFEDNEALKKIVENITI